MLGVDGLNLELLRRLNGPGYRALKARSTDCTAIFADYPLCAPTRASVLTGQPPFVHGQIGNAFVLSESVPTLVDHFSDHGLVCRLLGKQHSNNEEVDGAFGYTTVLGREEAMSAYGADYEDGLEGFEVAEDRTLLAEIEAITGLPLGGRVRPRSEDPDWVLLNEALRMAEEDAAADQPFFINAQLLAPHHPYSCPEEYYLLFDPSEFELDEEQREAWRESAVGRAEVEDHRWDELEDQHVKLLLARLYGMHAWADELLRYALEQLEDRGLLDQVVFAFTSDHGEMAGHKGLFLKTVFEDGASRIALLVRRPGQELGLEYGCLLCCKDLLPTLGGMMGLPAAEGIAGRDYSAALEAGAPGRVAHFAFTEMYRGYSDGLPHALGEMVRTERYKYCRFDERAFPEGEMEQLYDLVEDPEELRNLVREPGYGALAAELSQAIDAHLATMGELLVPLEKI